MQSFVKGFFNELKRRGKPQQEKGLPPNIELRLQQMLNSKQPKSFFYPLIGHVFLNAQQVLSSSFERQSLLNAHSLTPTVQ